MPDVSQACSNTSISVSGAPSASSYAPPAWAVEAAASAPRISPADAAPLLSIWTEARAACDAATGRFRKLDGRASDPVPRDPAIPGQLRARRDAALRLPPLPSGVRDPFGALAASA